VGPRIGDNVANPWPIFADAPDDGMPLVFASITLGVAGLGDIGRSRRAKTLAHFIMSTRCRRPSA
jgi:hypothetical protein